MNAPDRMLLSDYTGPEDDGVSRLRVPPHSIEAEQSIIGGLLIDNNAWDRVGDILTAADFYRHEHRLAFDAIGALVNATKPADVVTVHEQLQRVKGGDAVSMAYLNSMAQSVPSAANARGYAQIVRSKAMLRALVATSDEIATAAFSGDIEPQEQAQLAITAFERIQDRHVLRAARHADSLAVARIDHFNDLHLSGEVPGHSTGLQDLDDVLNGGLHDGRVYVLAARPSIGKTSLALQIGLHQAGLGRPALVLTQEESCDELADRAIANLGRVDYGAMQRGQLGDADWSAFSNGVEHFGRLPVWVEDQSGLTLRDIRAKAFSLRREGLKVLVIDYLQLCAGQNHGKGVNRNTEIEEISRGVKVLAKQLRISVLLLSQLNREVEKRASAEPTLGDLRDSGSIEQDADVVLALWFVRQWSDRKVMALTVLKNRQGKRGMRIPLEFFGQHQLWQRSDADVSPVVKISNNAGTFE